ncbi:MAG: hypothetical protein ACXVKA_03235 [Acidimicrobiia bacterium]
MNARTKVEEAARWRLEIGEPLLAGCFTWIAFPRPQVSLLVLARRPHFIGLTDRRILIWARPHEVRPAEDQDLVLDAPFADVTLDEVRTFSPMLQLKLTTESGRKLVLEFRPRDRRIGHRIAEALRSEDTTEAPPSAEVPATS